MTPFVAYNRGSRTYDFDAGDGLTVGIPEDEINYTLPLLRVVDSLLDKKWFTMRHLIELFALSKEHASWTAWQIPQ